MSTECKYNLITFVWAKVQYPLLSQAQRCAIPRNNIVQVITSFCWIYPM